MHVDPAVSGLNDFDFLVGEWKVRHRRLKERLANNHEWIEFDGTSTSWKVMDGAALVDDNVLELPADRTARRACARTTPGPASGRSGGSTAGRRSARSTRRCAAASATASAPSWPTRISTASRSRCGSSGPGSRRLRRGGSRRSRRTAGRPGRPTGRWTSPGSGDRPPAGRDAFRSPSSGSMTLEPATPRSPGIRLFSRARDLRLVLGHVHAVDLVAGHVALVRQLHGRPHRPQDVVTDFVRATSFSCAGASLPAPGMSRSIT